jgi:proton-translocating NADH-quinone oxidoreductase chain N
MNAVTAFTWLLVQPLVAAPVIYLAGRLAVRRGHGAGLARWLAVLAMLHTGWLIYTAGRQVLVGGAVTLTVGQVTLMMDGVGLLLASTVLALTFIVTVFSMTYMSGETGEEKYYALLTAMMGTMIGLGCTHDLFNLWIWFEAMAVTSYMLVAFYRLQRGALEAGVKYLVQSAVGSVLVLLGIAIVFGAAGTLQMDEIRAAMGTRTPMMLAAGALFVVGFGVKTALVPLHTWLPDAHSQAPSGISAMLSGVVIEAGLVALLRSVGCLTPASASWGGVILAFGALSMIVGNLMALRQTQVKRLLAYSSVSHIGYMLLGFGVAVGFALPHGAAGGFFHLITHALMKGLAFLAAGAFLYALHVAKGSHAPLMVDDLNGAADRYPLTAIALSVAVLALGGLPPLAGFMSKWAIMVSGFETHNTTVELLVVFAALNSVLSLGYYAPLVNRLYRNEPSAAVRQGKPIGFLMGAPLMVLTAAIIVVGFWPGIVDWVTGPAASSLVGTFAGPGIAGN